MDLATQDIALETAYQIVHYVDYRQTRVIAENPELFYERNPILGDNPSTVRVRNYFISTGLAHAAITWLLPQGPYRTAWQGLSIGWQAGVVTANYRLRVRF